MPRFKVSCLLDGADWPDEMGCAALLHIISESIGIHILRLPNPPVCGSRSSGKHVQSRLRGTGLQKKRGGGAYVVRLEANVALLCSALLCFALLCFALQCCAVLCFAVPRVPAERDSPRLAACRFDSCSLDHSPRMASPE